MAWNRSLIFFGAVLLATPSFAMALTAGPPVLETHSYLGGPSSGPCGAPEPSVTGRYLAFTCAANDIVESDDMPLNDTFLLDRQTRQVSLVSVNSQEMQSPYSSAGGFPSADGGLVAFVSYGPLHPDLDFPYWDNGWSNAFLRDTQAGTTELVSRDHRGRYPQITGRALLRGAAMAQHLVVLSTASNLVSDVPLPPGSNDQIYVRNWANGSVELITATPDGQFSQYGGTGAATISADGRFVAFMSGSDDLGPPNPGLDTHLMIRDRVARTTRRLSFPAQGGDFVTPYYQGRVGRLSGDGRWLALDADSDEVATGDAPGLTDVYVVDTVSGRYELISTGYGGAAPDGASFEPAISSDGRFVAFFSRASNLLSTLQPRGVYVKDRQTGELLNISANLGASNTFHIPDTRISADGSTVVFDWWHANSVPGVGGRILIYSVQLRGSPSAAPVAVPSISVKSRLVLLVVLGMIAIGWIRRMRANE